MLTVIPGSTGPATVETAALDAASGCLMDVHGVLHDDRHLGLQLCIPDAFLKEPCGGGKEPLSVSFSRPVLPHLSDHLVRWEIR